ncbi:MAG: endonuclease III [Candidatus Eisenbacteria bacterium]|nr:endonuclease III [Candidatus Eisenbacteria bacterium]
MARSLEARFGMPTRAPERDLIAGLVRTVLSQNTTDTNSSRAYMKLRERFPRWDDVERADARSIEAAIRSGGLARTKARRIKALLREIRRTRGSLDLGFLRRKDTDEVIEYLLGMDGVGPKTAACVALFDLGRDVMPVDTHVHRIIRRTGVVGSPSGREVTYRALRGLVPKGTALSLHVNLVRLGRELCHPRSPRCEDCPIRRDCAQGLLGGCGTP